VTNMSYIFDNTDFNFPLNFNTSKVENMEGMFRGVDFNQPFNFDISDWIILDTTKNQDVIEYQKECIEKNNIKEAIIKESKSNKNVLRL